MDPGIQETGLDGVITEFARALMAQRQDQWYPSGTAVVIAPHLALTVRHVVDDYWRQFDQNWRLRVGDNHGEFGLLALQVLPGRQGVLWAVRRLWRSEHLDLAILELSPYSENAMSYRWRCPSLRLLPPHVGAGIHTFGYHGGSADAEVDDAETRTSVHWRSSPSTAVGQVTEVHEVRRDRGLLDFPCFCTNAPFTNGMSGGPVFHEGRLSGVICAGGLEGVDGQRITYGVTLWPLLALRLQLDVAGEPPGSRHSVAALIDRGLVRAVDRDRFVVIDRMEELVVQPRTS
jgi:hypothetical protein